MNENLKLLEQHLLDLMELRKLLEKLNMVLTFMSRICSLQKFLDHAALQCGICTPGILVAAKALLEKNPDPTESEVRYWLAGNLCRCTGYDKIIRAVMDAAKEMRS